jgi:hypothetical protein
MKQEQPSIWPVTVDELVAIFRAGLMDLIPTFDRAHIPWRGDQTYDDFERVAEALYDSVVRDSLASARGLQGAMGIARYGLREQRERSRILVNDPSLKLSLLGLISLNTAFDAIQCVRIDSNGVDIGLAEELPFDGARFLLEARFADGPPRTVREVQVEL